MARRRDRWLKSILDALEQLESARRLSLDAVLQNHAFLAVLLQATRATVDTEDAGKLQALECGVRNAALSSDPDQYLREGFVPLIDALTPFQLRMLRFCHNPARNEPTAGDIRGNAPLAATRFADLERRGLVEPLPAGETPGASARRLTPLGQRLVEFITGAPT
jgi:hypothetical protein